MNQKRDIQIGSRIRYKQSFLGGMGLQSYELTRAALSRPLGIVFEIVPRQRKMKDDRVRYRTNEGYVGSTLMRNAERCRVARRKDVKR